MPYHKMTPDLQYQHLVDKKKSASEEVELAGEDLQSLNKESLNGFDTYYDKILFYSAGAFSFSLALVNVITEQSKVEALTKISFILPNIFWLYGSWICYLAVCILIIWNKKLHAVYTGFYGMGRYTEKLKNLRNAEAALLSSPLTQVVSVTNSENAIKELTKDAKMIADKEKENKQKAEHFYKLKMRVANAAELLALTATALLLLGSILITQTFIWE